MSKEHTLDALKDKKYGFHVENLCRAYFEFYKNVDITVKTVTLRALGFLFAAYPGIGIRAVTLLK